MWLQDYGFDGLRLDAVHAIYSFEAVHILEELAAAVRELAQRSNRRLVLIAESDLNDPRLVRSVTRGGYGLDAHWADDFHHAIHSFFTGERTGYYADFHGLADIARALACGYVYQGQYSEYRRRRHGRTPHGVSSDQIVVFAQNHDQIGNRARGERLSMLLNPPQLKAIAALILLTPFVPMLFQGEEWGSGSPFLYFTDHQNAELGRLVAEGRSREFHAFAWSSEVPNPQAPETFERSKLNWAEAAEPRHADLLLWYQRLIDLRRRRARPGRNAKPKIKFHEQSQWLRFAVGETLAMFNFAAHAQHVPMPPGDWELVLSSATRDVGLAAEIPAHGTRIYRVPVMPAR
jgi:maltooligosyltrehalose trehalohydrolase